MTTSSTNSHTCANCFAEFEWEPFTQDGEEFCCSGCAEGGPCICTYEGAPQPVAEAEDSGSAVIVAAVPGLPGEEDGEGESEAEGEEPPAASADDSGAEEPPEEPPAPEQASDDEPPTNGRLAVIMGAISEMPLPVQEVVRARLSTEGTEEEIGEPLGLTGDEVRQLLAQGQAILDRTLGTGFRIRYIAAEQIAAEAPPEPEFPPLDSDEEPESPLIPPPLAGQDDSSELGRLIARSVDSLTRVAGTEGPEQEIAAHVLAETLREAGDLFRRASERLGGTPQIGAASTAPAPEIESISLVVENAFDVGLFFVGLQAIDSVVSARLEQVSPTRAVFGLRINSLMGLVRGLMAMAEGLRPSRLQMSDREITMELPVSGRPPVAMTGVQPPPADTMGQQFELAVDSFFGARHFVESGGAQGTPHHHSYRVEASFVTSQPDEYGFVVGFARIREIVDTTVMDYSETLLNTEEPFGNIPPTTENLARVFHEKIVDKLRALGQPEVRLKHVRVWESPTNSATYSNSGPGPDAAATA